MSVLGPGSIPGTAAGEGPADLPSLEDLRIALRPPELPAPAPRSALEAAHRVMDLVHAERYREAVAVARQQCERTREHKGADAELGRLELLRSRLVAEAILGGDGFEDAAADLVGHLRRCGHRAQASATVTVLFEGGRLGTAPATPVSDTGGSGRRRGPGAQVPPELFAVVRALQSPPLRTITERAGIGTAGPRRIGLPDPRSELRVLEAARAALPAVREQLLGDPEPLLLVRLAQAREMMGDPAGATSLALDVLELLDAAAASGNPLPDPQRSRTSAHALLARTLRESHPTPAAHHAVDALLSLRTVDDPPLRIGLITDLLHALMAAGLTAHAGFTAGRLLSLQRTLPRDAHRAAPLLAVAAQRIDVERYEAAWVPLEQARLIARQERDRRAGLEAARLAASIHERTGDARGSLVELRRVAADARWLADDLATAPAERSRLVLAELQAQALVMRRAMDLGETSLALSAAGQVERRTRDDGGRPVLPTALLWDHRVDALVGRFVALGDAAARGEQDHAAEDVERARLEALRAIDAMPPGHDERARYWAAYLAERHAGLLARRGEHGQALTAARRALAAWQAIDAADDAARTSALVDQLEAADHSEAGGGGGVGAPAGGAIRG